MTPASPTPLPRLVAALAVAAVVGLGLALRWTTPAAVADLRPRPDALEYEEGARHLARGDGYWLEIAGGRYPPRYPIGFSALLVPAFWVAGDAPGTGIVVVLASAAVAIAATIGLGATAGGLPVGLAAGLLLALAPLHVRWSQAVMADVPTTTAVALLAWWGLVLLARRDATAGWAGLGVCAALAASIRPVAAAVVLPLATMLAVRGAIRPLAALCAGAALGLVPSLAFAWQRFGTPFGSGYGYWVIARFFAPGFVTGLPDGGGTMPNGVFYLRELLGLGRLYPPPTAILVALGTVLALRTAGGPRRLLALAAGVLVVLLALHLPFFWQWDRFLLPALPLCCALAAMPLRAGGPAALRAAAVVLVVAAAAWPLRTPGAFAAPDPDRQEVAALRIVAATVEPNAVVVARTHPFLFDRLVHRGTDRLWVPVGQCEHCATIARWRLRPSGPAADDGRWMLPAIDVPFDADAVAQTLAAIAATGRPVYYAPLLDPHLPPEPALAHLLDVRFQPLLADPGQRIALYRLTPPRPPAPAPGG
ncbi:MAG: hypothetical protein KIT14_17850 [bacterium]|nr:hypothetical protein [bacterium]